MELKILKLKEGAKVPTFAHPGDAGADLFALEKTIIEPGQRGVVPTGIAIEIPEGCVGLVWDKSGLATKKGITTIAGVIDAGYRGEILVAVYSISNAPHTFEAGDKIAQLLIQPIEHPTFIEKDSLSDTSRGEGGFGSTGTK